MIFLSFDLKINDIIVHKKLFMHNFGAKLIDKNWFVITMIEDGAIKYLLSIMMNRI